MDQHQLELLFVCVLVVLLLGLAGFFGWRQWQTLRGMRLQSELSADDQSYLKHQSWRRLVGCALMVVLAALLAGAYWIDFDARAAAIAGHVHAAESADTARQRGVEQQRFINLFSFYWIFTILVLLAMVCLGAIDLLAIRRYGIRSLRKIQSERRAMIEDQVAIFRSQRNGHQ